MGEPPGAISLVLATVLLMVSASPALELIPELHTVPSAVGESEGSRYFTPNIRITDGTSQFPHQVEPYIVVDEQNGLFVGWKEAWTADGPGRRVGFSKSADGGFTWAENALVDLQVPGRYQSDPWLALDELGRLYYSRLEFSEDDQSDGVMVSRSDDGGETWGSILNIDDQPNFADKEAMASNGNGSLYVVYDDVDLMTGDTSIRFTHSTDGGGSWSPTNAVPSSAQGAAPVIATQPDSTVHVAWWEWGAGDVMSATSGNRGESWMEGVQVNSLSGSAPGNADNPWRMPLPSMVSDAEGGLYVAWPDRGEGNLDILVARSLDHGMTWSTPSRVNDDGSGREQRMVALAVDGQEVLHAAWLDNRTGNLNVYYSNSTDRGMTWSRNLRVTTVETPHNYARPGDYLGLAADRVGNAYVVWTDGRGEDLDIYFAMADFTKPTIEITSPSEGDILTSKVVEIAGFAEDNVALAAVEVSGNGTQWFPATGKATWAANLTLPEGIATIYARAIDASGNVAVVSIEIRVEIPPSFTLIAFAAMGVAALLTATVVIWRIRVRRRRDQ